MKTKMWIDGGNILSGNHEADIGVVGVTLEKHAALQARLEVLLYQLNRKGGADGHIYDGTICILCGHDGPIDEPEPCDAERRFADLKAAHAQERIDVATWQREACANSLIRSIETATTDDSFRERPSASEHRLVKAILAAPLVTEAKP